MKIITKRLFPALVVMACFATALSAGSFNFSNLVGQTVSLAVESYASGENDGGYYVGLTEGIVNGDASDAFFMYCVDFLGDISTPTAYDVTVVSLNPAFYSGSNQEGLTLAELQTEYILGQQFGSTPSGNSAQDSDIQHDLWNLTGGKFTADANMTTLLANAEAAQSTEDPSYFSNAWLLDVTQLSGQQAFMAVSAPPTEVINNANPLPEPVSLLLTGSGLLVLFIGRARRSLVRSR